MSQASACRQEFQACTSWEQRARLLLRHGQQLAQLTEQQRGQASLVRGCESPVWCLVELQHGRLQIRLDTDARLLRGLLAVLLLRIQGLTPQQLTQLDVADWFARLGLSRQLSASRANGLNAVLAHITARASEIA